MYKMHKTTKVILSTVLFATLAAPNITQTAHAAWGDIVDRVLDRQDDKAKRHTEDKANEGADKAVDKILHGSNKDKQPQEQEPQNPNDDANATNQEYATEEGVTFKDSRGNDVYFPNGMASFADEVISYHKVGNLSEAISNPAEALGAPNYDEVRDDSYVALGNGGNIVLKFTDNYLVDVPGPDLWVFEIGPAVEPTNVAISKDGKNWIHVGSVEGGTAGIDIGPKVQPEDRFSYVKLMDADKGYSPDGADIDAVGAIGSIVRDATEEDTHSDSAPNADECSKLRIEMKNGAAYVVGLDEIQSITTEPNGQRLDLRITLVNNESLLVDLSKVTQMIPVAAQ